MKAMAEILSYLWRCLVSGAEICYGPALKLDLHRHVVAHDATLCLNGGPGISNFDKLSKSPKLLIAMYLF